MPTRPTYHVTHYRPAQTAAVIRAELKKAFPATKFRVTTKVYAGGSSIDIRWTDGPTAKRVEEVTDKFSGKGFDGMVDLSYGIYAWVLNGEIVGTRSTGTAGSRGSVPAWGEIPPHDDCELVSFGGSYIFTNRRHSARLLARVLDQLAQYWGFTREELPAITPEGEHGGAHVAATREQDERCQRQTGRYWLQLVHEAAADASKYAEHA